MIRYLLLFLLSIAAALAADVFSTTDSCLFVVSGSSASYAGGCTKAYLDSVGNNTATIYGTDGAPLVAKAEVTVSGGIFYDADIAGVSHVGVCVYVAWTEGSTQYSGIYPITAVNTVSGETTTGFIGTPTSGKADLVVVGGAFGTIQSALDQANASIYSCIIYTNIDESISTTVTVSSTRDGTPLYNTKLYIIGYNTIPGDMDVGGQYYEPPIDVLRNSGAPTNSKTITWNAGGGARHIFTATNNIALEFRNIDFYNVSLSADYCGYYEGGTGKYITFINCRFRELERVMSAATLLTGVAFRECYIGGIQKTSNANNIIFDNCVIDLSKYTPPSTGGALTSANGATVILDSLVIGGNRHFPSSWGMTIIQHNTMVNPANSSLNIRGQIATYGYESMSYVSDNVFSFNDTGRYLLEATDSDGGSLVTLLDNNIVYAAEASTPGPLTQLYNRASSVWQYPICTTLFQYNPQFRNISTYDYRLNTARRDGTPNIYGDALQIGIPTASGSGDSAQGGILGSRILSGN